jgi:hypothetical protein
MLRVLLALRYRLLWAQTRSRNGKVALFFAGYLLAILIVVLLSIGGFGAAMASIRLGKADIVARIVLGAFFLNAMLIAVILGFGMNPAFSDSALRRFPITAMERLIARQLTSLLEPIWIFIFALDLGLGVGFYVLGVGSFWLGVVGAVVLAVANYLFARVILSTIERLIATRGGPVVVLAIIVCFALLPGVLAEKLAHDRALAKAFVGVLTYTPPFAAGSLMTGATAARALADFALLVAWIAVLFAIVFLMERFPQAPRTIAKAAARWDSPYDRAAAIFGPEYGPLVGKTLRYCLRNNRVRYNLLLAVPILGFLVYTQSRHLGPTGVFVWAVAVFAVLGFIGTASIAVNQFGFDGGGFRRYFLLPGSPAAAVRASSFTMLLMGAALIPVGFIFWFAWDPVPTDARMFVMLISSAFGGLLFFNALGLWTTLLTPRRVPFTANFGNQLSLGGNIVVIGGILAVMLLAGIVSREYTDLVMAEWWLIPAFLALSAVFYAATLNACARVFLARRERLLGIIEGRG